MIKKTISYAYLLITVCVAYTLAPSASMSFLKKSTPSYSIAQLLDAELVQSGSNIFWHLDFLHLPHQFPDKKTESNNIRAPVIALLDGEITNSGASGQSLSPEKSRLNILQKMQQNIDHGKSSQGSLVINQKKEKDRSWLMKKNQFWHHQLLKNHGVISADLIQSIAPGATLIHIPVLHDSGYATKLDLYHGLLKAREYNPDIVNLGLQVFDWDHGGALEQSITKLIQSFPIVIAAAGNRRDLSPHVGYPAAISGVLSVGCCGTYKNRYPFSNFSQASASHPVHFVMPGESIWTVLWIDEIQDYRVMPVSGTSFAAACMTGMVALVWEKNQGHLSSTQLVELIECCSDIQDSSWRGVVRYGTPNICAISRHLEKLARLHPKKVTRNLRKLRNSISSCR